VQIKNILGEQVTLEIAKRSEPHTFKVIPKRWGRWSAASLGWTNVGDYGKTTSDCSTPACSSSIWLS
jgi:hypothetical protein